MCDGSTSKRRAERADREAGVVHVGHRDGEREAVSVDAHLGDERALLAFAQPAAVALREDLDDFRAEVVARLRVILARVPETDHQEIGGHASALVAAGHPRNAAAAASPSAPSAASPSATSASSPRSMPRGCTTWATSSSASIVMVTDAGTSQVADADLVAHVDRRDVVGDRGRQVGGQRLDRDREQLLLEQTAVLHTFGFALEVQRHFRGDLLVGADAHEVDVQQRALHRVALDLAGERELVPPSPSICSVITVFAPDRAGQDVLQLPRRDA